MVVSAATKFGSKRPPNMMTSVSPGARLVAVREWEQRGTKDKGTFTWRQEKYLHSH